MMLAADFIVDLVPLPDLGGLRFGDFLDGMLRSRMDPQATRQLLERANAQLPVPLLRPQGVDDGGFLIDERLLFPQESTWWVVFQNSEHRLSNSLPPEAVGIVADFFRAATHAGNPEEVRQAWPFDTGASVQSFALRLTSLLNLPAPGRRQTLYLLLRVGRVLCF